jgi:PIH1 N-terminal domain
MEELLKQIKKSPEYSELSKKLTESQIKELLQKYTKSTEGQMDSEGGVMITPNKGYVVKTFDIKSNEKVFINICSHDIIDLPEEKDMPEVEGHLALRVPLSLGNPHPDHDKSNL